MASGQVSRTRRRREIAKEKYRNGLCSYPSCTNQRLTYLTICPPCRITTAVRQKKIRERRRLTGKVIRYNRQ